MQHVICCRRGVYNTGVSFVFWFITLLAGVVTFTSLVTNYQVSNKSLPFLINMINQQTINRKQMSFGSLLIGRIYATSELIYVGFSSQKKRRLEVSFTTFFTKNGRHLLKLNRSRLKFCKFFCNFEEPL